MDVILLEKVTNLGELGDKVSVKSGYGRNYLIPQKKAVPASKENIEHFAKSVDYDDIVKVEYNLSVSSYVEAKDNRVVTNITELNRDLKTTVAKIDKLRIDIDAIVSEIEGEEDEA